MINSHYLKIKEKIQHQIEDVMMAENINEKESIEFLKNYYSEDTTIFNVDYVLMILNSLSDQNYK